MAADSTPHPSLPKRPSSRAGPAPLLVRLLRRPWPPIDVLVLKTPQCCLCDEALELLCRWRRRLGLEISTLDISADPDLMKAYGEEIPVVFIAGEKRFMGRVNPVLLRRSVDAIRARRSSG